MPALHTFDVFDTLLTRRVGDPTSVFLAVGARLAGSGGIPCTPEAFARARQRAEPRAAALSPSGLATLSGIHDLLCTQLGLPEGSARTTAAAERETERELIVPVPGAAERVAAARADGEVAFVSDMYLPSEFVRSLLLEHGIAEAGETVYVSAEVGLSKRRGTLFPWLLKDRGLRGEDVVHTGDDLTADVLRPREAGIRGVHDPRAGLNRYETSLETHRWESEGAASALAGASRSARLAVAAPDARTTAIRDVAAGVAAPLLVGYVAWVLQQARASGLSRLYFVARDGEVLLEIARILESTAADPLDLRYLYGSRQAWYPAGLDSSEPREAIDWLVTNSFEDTPSSFLNRCGVDPQAWIRDERIAHISDHLSSVLQGLAQRPDFLSEVSAGIRGRQERLLAYAEQEGLLDGVASGIVDIGWRGRSLVCLADLLTRAGARKPTGFYLGFRGDPEVRAESQVWLLGKERRLRPIMMETFCVGTHGQVIDYAQDHRTGRWGPTLQTVEYDAAVDWGLPIVRATIAEFTKAFAETRAWWSPFADTRDAALDAFDLFYLSPTRDEASVWGSFPFQVGAMAAQPELLAPGRSVLRRVGDSLSNRSRVSRWPAGDSALAPMGWRYASRLGHRAASAARRYRSRSLSRP